MSAVLLAAGSARRMGQSKQLLPLGESTVIRRCIDSVITSGIKDIVVVAGSNSEKLKKETSDALKKLVDKHLEEPDKILVHYYNKRRGHPSLFPKMILRDIFAGLNLREIINKNPEKTLYIDVSDEGVVLDMDTMEDYKEILKRQSV